MLGRREFLQLLASAGTASVIDPAFAFALYGEQTQTQGAYAAARIPNEFSLFLPGEEESLKTAPSVSRIGGGELTATLGGRSASLGQGDFMEGWQLLAIGQFPAGDRRHGLIYGSPEADLGDPANDFPNSHPFYYQNSVWIWRGISEHSRCLKLAAQVTHDETTHSTAARYDAIAREMRANIQASLAATLSLCSPEMKRTCITPFTPDDIHHPPSELSSYENHRFMQDWFLADWGDAVLDLGHLKHREIAGMQIMGLHTDGRCRLVRRTSWTTAALPSRFGSRITGHSC